MFTIRELRTTFSMDIQRSVITEMTYCAFIEIL